jgi:uncharacterized protein YlzI (FlbEa/FlbD family)
LDGEQADRVIEQVGEFRRQVHSNSDIAN